MRIPPGTKPVGVIVLQLPPEYGESGQVFRPLHQNGDADEPGGCQGVGKGLAQKGSPKPRGDQGHDQGVHPVGGVDAPQVHRGLQLGGPAPQQKKAEQKRQQREDGIRADQKEHARNHQAQPHGQVAADKPVKLVFDKIAHDAYGPCNCQNSPKGAADNLGRNLGPAQKDGAQGHVKQGENGQVVQ